MTIVLVTDHPALTAAIEARMLETINAEIRIASTGQEDELLELVVDADAILTCFRRVSAGVIRRGSGLQVIGRYGVGIDNIDVAAATERGIPVTNVPEYCTDEVAEHAIALMLTLARRTAVYDASVRAGGWDIAIGMPIHRLAGRVLGIVGFGHVGRAVASRASGLGLRVVVTDRSLTATEAASAGVESVELDDLLVSSDVVSLHVPLTRQTRHLLDAPRLALMKPGALLINCARGGVVDLDAITDSLRTGHLAGAGLDVFDPERLPPDHPLMSMANTVLTPHVAFYSEESISELQRQATQNVMDVLAGRPANLVNPEVLSGPTRGGPVSGGPG
jgi:D-3-phosphoglycerate dehydrogenase